MTKMITRKYRLKPEDIGPCGECIVYTMCDDMCEAARNYLDPRGFVDNFTWDVMIRETKRRKFGGTRRRT